MQNSAPEPIFVLQTYAAQKSNLHFGLRAAFRTAAQTPDL
jgi:hypothetical protein